MFIILVVIIGYTRYNIQDARYLISVTNPIIKTSIMSIISM